MTTSLSKDLRESAEMVRSAMPCSAELPAGAGKTQTIAAIARVTAERGERALILTHTNAGVEALRRRLRAFGVSTASVRVETIASWSHALVRRLPVIAGLAAPPIPSWVDSERYYAGASMVAASNAVRRVLRSSYAFAVVDEYQDCTVGQHTLVLAIGAAVPVAVFGDRLQGLFDFGTNVPVRWETDVLASWPAVELPTRPWRWIGHNEALGQWLVDIRQCLIIGGLIDLKNAPVSWHPSDPRTRANICFGQPTNLGSVVAIGCLPHDCVNIAKYLNGSYTVMEELEGKFMLHFADTVDGGKPERVASSTLDFAKKCAANVTKTLDSAVAKKLATGKPVANLRRDGAAEALQALSRLLEDPSAERVRDALQIVSRLPGVRMYRHEAWHTVLQALAIASPTADASVRSAVEQIRNRVRVHGRAQAQRVISRPLLIKGLEYDHAVALDADVHSPTSLYVALTRARKTLTVISAQRTIRPAHRG